MNYTSYVLIAVIVIIIIYCIYHFFFKKKTNTLALTQDVVDAPSQVSLEDVQEGFKNTEKGNPYFDITIDGEDAGRLKFQLFDDEVPKTCANFRHLCTRGLDDKKEPCYQDSIFHSFFSFFLK